MQKNWNKYVTESLMKSDENTINLVLSLVIWGRLLYLSVFFKSAQAQTYELFPDMSWGMFGIDIIGRR